MHKLKQLFANPNFSCTCSKLLACDSFCNGFFEAKLTWLFKENTMIEILLRKDTFICETNRKNV